MTDPTYTASMSQERMSQLVREANAVYDSLPDYQKERTTGQNCLDVLIALDGAATIWPILRVQVVDMPVGGSRIAASMMFAPGLPAGDHDLYPARVRPVAPHEDTQLLDYVLPIVANYDRVSSDQDDDYDKRQAVLFTYAMAGVKGREAIRRAIRTVPPKETP